MTADDVPADRDMVLLRRAIAVADDAVAHGNHPFGAVLADRRGSILLEAENSVETDRDVTGHAETNLVRLAWPRFGADLAGMTLATSCEPCAMCSGAIYWAGIGRVVYALAEADLARLTGDDPANPTLQMPCRTVLTAGRRAIEVAGPMLEAEARAAHERFWRR